jgi:hypothetical protein
VIQFRSPLLVRGVYRAPCLNPDGKIILFAVDYQHRRIEGGLAYLTDESELEVAEAALWRLLDAVDPEHSRRRLIRKAALAS